MFYKNLFPVLGLMILFSACEKDDDLLVMPPLDDDIQNTSVHPSFDLYVQRFIDEGAARGFTIDLESKNITIQFTNINQQQSPNVVGMCTYDAYPSARHNN